MLKPDLLDALPDLVLLVKRDGTPVAQAGGQAVPELKTAVPQWSDAVATLVRQLTRKAIADRAPVEARATERDKHYEVRVTPQGPDRAVCVIRPALRGRAQRARGDRRAAILARETNANMPLSAAASAGPDHVLAGSRRDQTAPRARNLALGRGYWPWLTSTSLQALLILGRFSFRQDRTTRSP